MKKNYLPSAMIFLMMMLTFLSSPSSAQLPGSKSPTVDAEVSLLPNISELCIGQTVLVPIHVSGDNVLSIELILEFNHSVLTPAPGLGYANVYPGFIPTYNYSYLTYTNTSYLVLEKSSFTGTNFSGDKIIDLAFIYQGGTTSIHLRKSPDPTPPPICKLWNDLGFQITPVNYIDNVVTGYPNLVVGILSSNQTICTGSVPALLTSTAPNGTAPQYLWQSSTDNVTYNTIAGATQTTYQPLALTTTTYFRQIQSSLNTCIGPLPTLPVVITVNPYLPVSISIAPSGNPVCAGTSVTFTATPTNGGLTPAYQWKVDGADVIGATNATYSYIPVNNSAITCVLTSSEMCNTGSPATSNTVTMIVNPLLPVSLTIATPATTVCNGTPATFTATPVNGGISPAFQWRVNGSIAGTNSPVFTYTPVDGDLVVCLLASSEPCNMGNPATSNTLTMTVSPSLTASITITPSANGICAGTQVTFTSTPVNGGVTPAFLWKINGIDAPGATNATFTYNPNNGDVVRCEMTSGLTCVTNNPAISNNVTMTVNPLLPVGVTIAGSANPVCAGTSVTFTATPVNGGLAPVYQWLVNGTGVGPNNPVYTYIPVTGDMITCVLNSNETCTSGNPATSNILTMTVNPVLAVSVSIAASENPVCEGSSVTFTATPVNGGVTPAYQWKVNGTNVGTGMSTYSYVPVNGDLVICELNSSATCISGNPATSNPVVMIVTPLLPVSVSVMPSANTVCSGTSVIFAATEVNGGTTPVYQWRVNGINANNATNSTYSYSPVNGDVVTCELTSSETCVSGNPATSNSVTMTVNPILPVSVSVSASANPVCNGVSVSFTATPVNGGLTPSFLWMRNGIPVGTNNAVFSYSPANNDVITCILTSGETCVSGSPAVSTPVTMTVNPLLPVSLSIIASANPVCAGTTVLFTASAINGGTSPSYQWKVNGLNAGTNSATYSYAPANNDFVTCELTSSEACTTGNPAISNTITATHTPVLQVGSISADQTICSGITPAQLDGIAPLNGTSPTYQWQSSLDNNTFNNINGATLLNYQPGTLTTTTYYKQMQDATGTCGGPLPTNTVAITVNPNLPVAVAVTPSANPVCSGISVTFMASPINGGTTPAYQWFVNGNPTGANSNVYSYIPVDNDVVTCQLTSSETCTTANPVISNTVTMTVLPILPVSVTVTPSANPVCNGISVTFTASPLNEGTTPVYQWYVNGTPAGTNSATYSYAPANNDVVTCQLTSSEPCTSGSPAISNAVTMTVISVLPVSVAVLPSANPVCAGTSVTYTASPVNGGTTPVYQWYVNAVPAGTNSTIFTHIPVNNDVVTCELTSSEPCTLGSPAMSNTVTMAVLTNLPVAVAVTPSANPVCGPTLVTFTASPINGGTTPAYQWYVNGVASGTNSPTYAYTPANNDVVTCQLTSSEPCTLGNPVMSNTVTMTVFDNLLVGSISADQTICSGIVPLQLNGIAPSNGTSPVYQWQSSLDNNTFNNISGATLLNYQPGALTTNTYYKQLQDAAGTCGGPLATNTVTITVNPNLPVSVAVNPSANPVCAVTAVTFTASPINGGTTPSYQWFVNGTAVGFNSAIYSYTPVNNDVVTCQLTSSETCTLVNPVMSNTVTVTVLPNLPVAVAIAPSANPVCNGNPVTFTASPFNGGTTPAYNWYVNGVSAGTNNIAFTYIPANNDVVTCRLTSSEPCTLGNPAMSNPVTMTTLENLLVGSISADQTICSGIVPVQLNGIPPSNGTSPVYQWQSSLDNNTFNNISGATLLNYQPGALTTTTYYKQLQNATGPCGGPLPTNAVTITVNPNLPVAVAVTPSANPVCSGISVTFMASPINGGTTPAYQWFVNGNPTGANSSVYSYIPVDNDVVTCQLTSSETCTTANPVMSNTVTMTVLPILPVSVTVAPSANPVCDGISVTFTASPLNEGTTPVYQWYVNGTPAGTNSATYSYAPVNNDVVTCQLTSSEPCTSGSPAISNAVTMTVISVLPVSVAVLPSANPVCAGTSVTYTASSVNGGTTPVYQWYVNAVPAGTNSTIFTHIPVNNDVVTCELTSSEPCTLGSPAMSNTVTMAVLTNLPVAVAVTPSANPVCGPTLVTFTATPVNGGTTPAYQWYVNGVASGTNSATYAYTPANNDVVTCQLTSSEPCTLGNPVMSNTVTMTVFDNLLVGSISADQTICSGIVPLQLNGIAPSNGTSPEYQWQSSLNNITFSNISGATQLNYQPGVLTTTTYYKQLQDATGTCGGPLATNTLTITVIPSFVAGSIGSSQNICGGATPAQLSGISPTGGDGIYTYQWQNSTDNVIFTDISGANSLDYQPGALLVTTYYRQIQTGVCGGPLTTNTVMITIDPPLAMGSIFADQTICSGSIPANLTGTAPANGTAPTYQWQSSLDNVTFANINGATALNYQPGALTTTTYYLQLQNATGTCGGPLPTNVVTITVTPQLVVGSISADQVICYGTIPAQLNGVAPMKAASESYQWQSSTDNVTFTDIPGAIGLNYQPLALTVTTYFRQWQDKLGTCGGPLVTNVVTITVTPDIIVGSISADQTICINTAPFQLNGIAPANGTAPVYQWQSSLDNITFANINGATALNYQPGVLSATTYYQLLQSATGTCGGPKATNVVTITTSTDALLVPGTIGSNQTICINTAPAALVGTPPANGTAPTYQWQSSLNNVTFANISGATALTYQPGVLAVKTYYQLLQNATGTCGGPLPTNVVVIDMTPNLAVGSISANQSICAGNTPAQLNGVAPANGTAPTYQWQSSLDNITFANISGATMLNYQPGAIVATTYFRQMQDALGTCQGPLPTNVVTITFNPNLIVGSISANQAVCPGNTPAQLNGIAPGNGTSPSYQWQSSLDNITFANISGATMLNYQPGSIVATTYYRQQQNALGTCGGPLPTNVVTISINPGLVVGSISASQSICAGTAPALLNGVAPSNGTSPTYQWQSSLDNVTFSNLSGATMLNYQPGILAATTYFRQQQNASGACNGPLPTNVVTITVNPVLTVGSISANQTICSGSIPAQLIGVAPTGSIGPYTYQWQNSTDNVTFTNIGGAINLNYQPGALTAVTYYRQIQSSACGTPVTTNVVTISIYALPVPTITGPASVCLNSVGNIYNTEAGMTGYTWTVSAGGTITAGAGTSAITVTWSTTGAKTVTVNYTNANNCTAATPATYNVTVNALPVPTIAGPASVCLNSTGNVYNTEAGMTGYTWTVSAGGTITAGTGTSAITVTWSTIGAKTVTVNYNNANGCTAATPTTYNVTVNALPVPTIAGPASVCLNSTGNVYNTEAGMTGYTWTVSAGGTITAGTGTSAITVTWSTIGAKTVTVNYNNVNGCTAVTPATYTVTVNALPVPTIAGPASVCLNSTGNIYTTQTGMTGYTWTVSAGGTITAGAGTSAITVTWSTVGAKTVTVNYANANGCTAATAATYNVTVNALPVPTIAGPATVCVNSTGNVYTTETGMTGYTWTVSAGGAITAGSGTSAITVTWSTAGAKTVTVNYNNANGCTAASPATYNVTVNASPTPTITGPALACQGGSATYTTQTGMTNYVWTVSAGGTITAGGTSTSSSVTVTWNAIGAQTVTVTYTNICPAAAPAIYNVTVNSAPVPTIGSTNNPCVGSTNNIYYTESGMTGYVWTVSAGGTIVSGQGTSSLDVTWNQLGIQTVTVNYANASGCLAATPTVYTVFVNSPPSTVGAITGTSSLCAGTNGVVYSTTPVVGATSYTWSVPAGATIASGAGSTSITVNFGTSAVSGAVTVSAVNQCGNGPVATFAVTVNPLPAAAGTITGPASVCAGSTGLVYTVPAIASATSYVWTVPAGATITAGGTTNSIVVSFGNTPASGVITVKGTNTCGSGTVSPNFNVTINAIPSAPVVTAVGSLLTSSIANGNQWYYEGTGAIPGATNQTYTATITGWYWSVVSSNGCSSDTSNHVYVLFVGQEELMSSNFNIYPVPNNGKFNVSIITPTQQTFTIEVYNVIGEKFYEQKDVTTTGGKFETRIDLGQVARGIYTVVFLNSEYKVVRKMFVNR